MKMVYHQVENINKKIEIIFLKNTEIIEFK